MDISQTTYTPFLDLEETSTKKAVTLANREVGNSFIRGQQSFSEDANYYAAIIDKASNGRLSLKFFRELKASQLLRNLEKWQKSYSWERYSVQEQKKNIVTPSLYQMILAAYGVERNGRLELDNDNFKKDQFQKLVISLIDGRAVPANIAVALNMNIKKRMNYENTWGQIQFATLAIFSHANEKEQQPMLDRENSDRSYLYGRLLAILDQTEATTYTKSDSGKQRITNAQKFWTSYTNHPAKTMQTLIEKTKSYEKALKNSNPGFLFKLNKEKQEIINMLSDHYLDTRDINKALDYHFIFGYYAETQFLFTKTEKSESEEVENVSK